MQPERLPKEDFEQLPETPVEILPFDPESKRRALSYEKTLNDLLKKHDVSVEFFGSVALEVAGKGEWEFAVWLNDDTWYPTLTTLINHYKSIWVLDDDFAVFHFQDEGHDIELLPMRGQAALRNQAIMHYWRTHPEQLKEYEQLKYKYAHSKREYYWWKHNFIGDILEGLQD